jgi:L-2-hydroxyglutarate oxidase LhgO
MDQVDAIIVGAGVVGLAVAARLAASGLEVIVLERAQAIGTVTSSRNSEVIHGGMYYPTGSLKAQLCVAGRRRLYAYCAERGIGHHRIGKLIVATNPAEHSALAQIASRAQANGLVGDEALISLTGAQAMAMEPALYATAALFSPATGIVDSHGLMVSLQGDLEAKGGVIAFETSFASAKSTTRGFEIVARSADGSLTRLGARYLINAAGLSASKVAEAIEGLAAEHVRPTFLSRGCYFSYAGKAPFKHLIYPVPLAASLGVHLTIDLGGQAKFGPDHDWIDKVDYTVDPARVQAFYAAIRPYFPGLEQDTLTPSYAGIRPKVERPGGSNTDFVIDGPSGHGLPGLVNLFGIESPGLTSCLALADLVAASLKL